MSLAKIFVILVAVGSLSCVATPLARKTASAIPELPDFSFAGYHAGESPSLGSWITAQTKVLKVTDFGAKADDATDDSDAFNAAIQQAAAVNDGAVVFVPSGTYLLRKQLLINHSRIVLRGNAVAPPVLHFPLSLAEWDHEEGLRNPAYTRLTTFRNSDGALSWSFVGGMIRAAGRNLVSTGTRLTSIDASNPVQKGERQILVQDTSKIKVSQWVRVVETDPALGSSDGGSLLRSIYGHRFDFLPPAFSTGDNRDLLFQLDPGWLTRPARSLRFASRVAAVEPQTKLVTLERALPLGLETRWTPELHRFDVGTDEKALTQEIGIENLVIRFTQDNYDEELGRDLRLKAWVSSHKNGPPPPSPPQYPGHFREQGYNAIELNGVANSWVQNIKILNADSDIFMSNSDFCSVDNVVVDTDLPRALEVNDGEGGKVASVGHHGISIGNGADNLVTHFHFRRSLMHDLSVESYSSLNVFSQGDGVNLNLDHHRRAPFANLYTELNLGAGTRAFASGGSTNRGPHAGILSTFWSLRAEDPAVALGAPPSDPVKPPYAARSWGADLVFFSVQGLDQLDGGTPGWRLFPDSGQPKNLFLYQRGARLGSSP